MLQRIQTVFLILSIIISILLLYLPVYQIQGGIPEAPTLYKISSNSFLNILNGGIGVLTFLAIFLFRKRNVQLRLCNVLLLLCCGLVGLLFFVADTFTGNNQEIHYLYGSYLPIIQIVFIFLATLFIRRDEALVRSADRLR